jgi:transposase
MRSGLCIKAWAFRGFVGLSQDEPVWDHSSFSANRDRLLKESVMREFFGGGAGWLG